MNSVLDELRVRRLAISQSQHSQLSTLEVEPSYSQLPVTQYHNSHAVSSIVLFIIVVFFIAVEVLHSPLFPFHRSQPLYSRRLTSYLRVAGSWDINHIFGFSLRPSVSLLAMYIIVRCCCCMLISRSTAPEQPVKLTQSHKMAKRSFTNLMFLNTRILTNFRTESHEFSNYAVNYGSHLCA